MKKYWKLLICQGAGFVYQSVENIGFLGVKMMTSALNNLWKQAYYEVSVQSLRLTTTLRKLLAGRFALIASPVDPSTQDRPP